MTPGERLRNIRNQKGFTQIGLEKISGIQRTNLSGYENNRTKIGIEVATKLAKALDCEPADILFGGKQTLKEAFANNALKEIPLLTGTVSASTFTHSFTEWEGEMIAVPVKNIKNKVAWKISGHSMDAPDGTGYQDGEVVILDNSVQFLDGDHVVAENDHGVTIKEIKIIKDGSKEGTIELRPLNPDYPTIKLKKSEKFEILGVVIASYRERKRKKRG